MSKGQKDDATENPWDGFTKTLKPIKKAPRVVHKKEPAILVRRAPEFSTPAHDVSHTLHKKPLLDWNAPLDKKTERMLRGGDIAPDASLDLHGMTQVEAHTALIRFIATQIKHGNRILLVITGRGGIGLTEGEKTRGVLRSNLRHWLESMSHADAVLRLAPAAPRYGGHGAFYVVLRRKVL